MEAKMQLASSNNTGKLREPRPRQPSGNSRFSLGHRSVNVPASFCPKSERQRCHPSGRSPPFSCSPSSCSKQDALLRQSCQEVTLLQSPEGSAGAAVAGALRDLGDHRALGTMGTLDAAGIHFQTMRRNVHKRGNMGISARPLCSRPEETTPRCNFSVSCTFLNVGGLMRLATSLADQTGKCCGKPNAELNKSLLVGEARPRLAPSPTSESRSRGPAGAAEGAEPGGDVVVTESCDQTCFPVWESKYYYGEQERRPSL